MKLAIKGHPTRGREVIELLEMMGGHATVINKISNETDKVFFISDNENCFYKKSIRFIPDSSKEIEEFTVFTLEEFLEKYPFKVGELKDLLGSNLSCVISEMRWNTQAECVEYHATFGLNDYGWHKVSDFCRDYQIEELNTVISGINLNSCDYADEVELNLGDYEIEVRDGRTYAVKKKSKYPTTYTECCEVIANSKPYAMNEYYGDVNKLLQTFQSLLICHNAYMKIAGEQMGLDGPWEPDLENEELYCVQNYNKQIIKSKTNTAFNKILIFPTEEMRDRFYDNLKEKI